ncbi:MAG: hypothetical protein A2Z20_10225 [Bdellovibrionales bacterium RBG_16_40_8]|nr:MAG: hypothetical protein A2Z20_10225 [Bdellovibrionales bacterium RBG_16_40_8]
MKAFLLVMAMIVFPLSSFATKFYKSSSGIIKSIDAAALDDCAEIYYRKAGSASLSVKHKTALVHATLKGLLVNDLEAVKLKLHSKSGACTYGEDNESF